MIILWQDLFHLMIGQIINLYMIKLYNSTQLRNNAHLSRQQHRLDLLKRVQKFQQIIKQEKLVTKKDDICKSLTQMFIPICYTDKQTQQSKQSQNNKKCLIVSLNYTQKKPPKSSLQKRNIKRKRLITNEDQKAFLTIQHSSLPVRTKNILTSLKKQKNTIINQLLTLQKTTINNKKKNVNSTMTINQSGDFNTSSEKKNLIHWDIDSKKDSKQCKSSMAKRNKVQKFMSVEHSRVQKKNCFLLENLEQQIQVDPWKVDPQF